MAARKHMALAADVAELLTIARDNPWWQFEKEDIAKLMNMTENTVALMARADDTPFANDRSRPERVAQFLAAHPGWKPSKEK